MLSGEFDVALCETPVAVGAGEVTRFDGGRDITPTAVEPSAVPLVLAERTD